MCRYPVGGYRLAPWSPRAQAFRVRQFYCSRRCHGRLSSVSLATLRRLTQALHVHFPGYAHAGGPVSASVS
ncbi:hypothetical protein NDU88_000961 [Pleurodeles waltl]|uniref:Uncharacterized protein n=1 Tax=Pleurodeles waltl TaxID=8319 RepID=A0AAV7MKE1_PLEWA|nr:hypothetical protein NDU88_000961 [Pleurodeles waltl]